MWPNVTTFHDRLCVSLYWNHPISMISVDQFQLDSFAANNNWKMKNRLKSPTIKARKRSKCDKIMISFWVRNHCFWETEFLCTHKHTQTSIYEIKMIGRGRNVSPAHTKKKLKMFFGAHSYTHTHTLYECLRWNELDWRRMFHLCHSIRKTSTLRFKYKYVRSIVD